MTFRIQANATLAAERALLADELSFKVRDNIVT
jgi:hypothetical protein